jgi:hypothetical protein
VRAFALFWLSLFIVVCSSRRRRREKINQPFTTMYRVVCAAAEHQKKHEARQGK